MKLTKSFKKNNRILFRNILQLIYNMKIIKIFFLKSLMCIKYFEKKLFLILIKCLKNFFSIELMKFFKN